jgi:hypothetical protein
MHERILVENGVHLQEQLTATWFNFNGAGVNTTDEVTS